MADLGFPTSDLEHQFCRPGFNPLPTPTPELLKEQPMSRAQTAKGLNADLENFELTDVMQLITQQVKCGILSVEGNDGKCSC